MNLGQRLPSILSPLPAQTSTLTPLFPFCLLHMQDPVTAFDGISKNNHASPFTPESLSQLNMMSMGAGLMPSGGNYSACPKVEQEAAPVDPVDISEKKAHKAPRDALYFSSDQLAQNQ